MSNLTRLHDFLCRARRRAVAAVLLDQAVVASGAAFAGVILLLFLGSQILDWYWVLILSAGTFLFGLYRTLRRVPSTYRLAQQVDRRLALEDYLSTAHYFSGPESNGRGSREFREVVCERAARMCERITAEAAAPIHVPRSAYATMALVVVAVGMFSVRYLTRGSLDFGPPLVPAVIDFFRPSWLLAQSRKELPRRTPGMPPQAGLVIDPETGERQDPVPTVEETGLVAPQQDKYSSEASSLLDKMQEAFKDMLDKLGLRDEAREAGEAASKDGKPSGKDAEKGEEKGDASEEFSAELGPPRPDQQGEPAGPGDDKSAEAQKRASETKGQDDSEGGEGSGIGSTDGNKEIREAQQLAAMGKISEILGKRQADLTGEMMVEVTSSKEQKLTTPYSASDATHSEGGGEIHRDAVPLMYREYVQQYFEQVRKQAPAPAAPSKP